MKFDATATLANLMIGDDRNLPNRLREQKADLTRYKCVKPEIGKWLEDFELPVLVEILNSPDDYFFEKFPKLKLFTRSKRRTFAKEVQEHCKICKRCRLKVSQDLDWEKEVESFVFNHKDNIKKSLENKKGFFKTKK